MSKARDSAPEDLEDAAIRERLREAIRTLELVAGNSGLLALIPADERVRLQQAAASVFNPDTRARRLLVKAVVKRRKAAQTRRDDGLLSETGIRKLRRRPVYTTPNIFPPESFEPLDIPPSPDDDRRAAADRAANAIGDAPTVEARHCYICKEDYTLVHHFYDSLCPACAELNFAKRTELADLRGRVALLTGGRVKIGYQAGLKLLRSGAHLLVTTRFPRDSAMRYGAEPDFDDWGHRLDIFGLDLRHAPSVDAFCRGLLDTRARLDFIINNACQTVRRPPEFYAHMMTAERALSDMPSNARRLLRAYEALRDTDRPREAVSTAVAQASLDGALPTLAGLTHAPELSQVRLLEEELAERPSLFPRGQLDQDLQQVDLRGRNSWRLLLAEVSPVELVEVQLVNAIAPFIINARLKPLMLRTPERDKHIVNVSAVEGQFYRNFKTTRHPHTNMAKAALNMMTRTSATDYHGDGIHMNSVDTGWVTDEDPVEIAARKTREHRFHPPLDIVDGAARIVDPIVSGINTGVHMWGQFLKDFRPTSW